MWALGIVYRGLLEMSPYSKEGAPGGVCVCVCVCVCGISSVVLKYKLRASCESPPTLSGVSSYFLAACPWKRVTPQLMATSARLGGGLGNRHQVQTTTCRL